MPTTTPPAEYKYALEALLRVQEDVLGLPRGTLKTVPQVVHQRKQLQQAQLEMHKLNKANLTR